jgi:hypothetical protein
MYKGPHAFPYSSQIWAYDLNDLAAVKAGQKQPWEVVPYGVWPISLPTPELQALIGGVGYDAARQTLYLSQLRADPDNYSYRAVIHSLKIKVPGTSATTSGGTTGTVTIGGTTTGTGTTTTTTPAPAQLAAPAAGSTLSGSNVDFQWSAGTSVSEYRLDVGTAVGAFDVFEGNSGTATHAVVSTVPTTGRPVNARLWSLINGAWQYSDYTFTAANNDPKAQMIAPIPGSTLSGSTVAFQWTAGTGVSQYWLEAGTGPVDIYGADQGTKVTGTVSSLPTNGRKMSVRLWSKIAGAWQYNDYEYMAASSTTTAGPPQFVSPAPGSTLTASTVPFQWTAGTGASQYWLYVGTTLGGNELADQDRGQNLSATAPGLPTDGRTVYARLWYLANGAWVHIDATYTSASGQTSTAVAAQLITPAPGSTLSAGNVQFQWTAGAGVSQYWLYVGTTPGGNELGDQDRKLNLNATITGLRANVGPIYVRLWSLIGGQWYRNDYVYTGR